MEDAPDEEEDPVNLTPTLPTDVKFVRDVNMQKKGAAGIYVLRRIVTTASHIYFCQVCARTQRETANSTVQSRTRAQDALALSPSNDVILFSQVDQDEIMDDICLHEIASIQQLRPIQTVEGSGAAGAGQKIKRKSSALTVPVASSDEAKSKRMLQRIQRAKAQRERRPSTGNQDPIMDKIDSVFDHVDINGDGTSFID